MAKFISPPVAVPTPSAEAESAPIVEEQSPHYQYDHSKPFNREQAGKLDAMTSALRLAMKQPSKDPHITDAQKPPHEQEKLQRFHKVLKLLGAKRD